MSSSPSPTNCCGKRPRTPRSGIDQASSVDSQEPEHNGSILAEPSTSCNANPNAASNHHVTGSSISCDSNRSCREHTETVASFDADDAHTVHEDEEPFAKVPRNSPTQIDNNKEDKEDDCISRLEMQQRMRQQQNHQRNNTDQQQTDDHHSKETARSNEQDKNHNYQQEKGYKDESCPFITTQSQPQSRPQSFNTSATVNSSSAEIARRRKFPNHHNHHSHQHHHGAFQKKRLPIAPRLADYMTPGGTLRFRPRPEWYNNNSLGNNNTTSNSYVHRAARSSDANQDIFDLEQKSPYEFRQVQQVLHHQLQQEHHQEPQPNPQLEQLQQQQQQALDGDAAPVAAAGETSGEHEELEETDVAISAAPSIEVNEFFHVAAAEGVLVAPDNGLLPEGAFGAYFHQDSSINRDLSRHPYADTNTNDDEPYETPPPDGLPPPTTFGRDYDPALHVTIRENATEASLALLQHGAPVDAENGKGVTPLILASQKGNLRMVRELLVRGASTGKTSINGTTAVLQASHFGHIEILEVLLDAGGWTSMEIANYNLTTPLMRAAQEGHKRVVLKLLERGALVNRRNRLEMTALMLASQRGHAQVCKILIQHGADLDSMTAQNSTSLMLACKRGNVDVVRVLVTAGCELWVKDSRGRTARDIAQRRGTPKSALVQLLNSSVQIEMMQQQQRRKRNYTMVLLWNLLQQERAFIPMENCPTVVDGRRRVQQVTIHQVSEELKGGQKNNRLDHRVNLLSTFQYQPPPQNHLPPQYLNRPFLPLLPPTLPYHLSHNSTQALLRTMTLPAPLVNLVTSYIPLPLLWEHRVGMLTKRSIINADAAVDGCLDLIDEVLEEGGFVEACDYARVTPPTHFGSWCEWKAYCRLRCRQGVAAALPDDHQRERPIATLATIPPPQDPKQPSSVEVRRQVGFLQILANRSPILARVLAAPPFNMPMALIEQLITSSDIQSLVRRMGSRGVHFEPPVAMDLVMMSSRLCSWYSREREDSSLVKVKSQKIPLQHAQLPNLLARIQSQQPLRVPLVEGAFSPPNGASRNYNHQPSHDGRV